MTEDRPASQPSAATVDFLGLHLKEMPLHRAILRSVEAKLMSRVPLVPPILDIGTGDGHFAWATYQRPIDLGVEVRWNDLQAAARRTGTYRQVVAASAVHLPFRDEAFGTVVSNCVIEHIPDLGKTLQEIARVLRSGGTFATTLPSEYFADYLLGTTLLRQLGRARLSRAYGSFFNRISSHHHVYPPEVWRDLLKAAGLEPVEHTYYFSAAAHRAFDLCHYLSVPHLVLHALSGRWVAHSLQARPFEGWLRRFYDEPFPTVGAYQFVRCVKPMP